MNIPFTTTFKTDKGPCTVSYNNGDLFRSVCGGQSGLFDRLSPEQFNTWFNRYHRNCWNRRWGHGLWKEVPTDNPITITDIGCGHAFQDLMSAVYMPNASFHLIDGDEFCQGKNPTWTADGSFIYNDWNVVRDGIASNNLDPDRFVINTLGRDPWPMSDIVTSFYSWCFHYSTDVYLEKVLASLKPGGKLYLTIRMIKNDPSIEKISNALGVRPEFMNTYDVSTKSNHIPVFNDAVDYFYAEVMWIRPKA